MGLEQFGLSANQGNTTSGLLPPGANGIGTTPLASFSFGNALGIAGIGLNVGTAIASGNTAAIAGTGTGALIGGAIGSYFPGVGTILGASLGSSIGGMFGKGGSGGDGDAAAHAANLLAVNNQQSISSQIKAYRAIEPQLPMLLAYSGQSPEAINQTITNQRKSLGMAAYNEAVRASGVAWEARTFVPLLKEAARLGVDIKAQGRWNNPGQEQFSANTQADPLPPIDPNFALVQPRKSGVDYTQGGDKFVFHPEAPGAEYTAAQEIGTKAINRQLAARGLYNSEAGVETLSRFNKELAGQEEQRQYANKQQEYGEVMAANLGERANQQDIFGRLLASTGLDQQFALSQQQIANNMQIATMQAQTQLAASRGQLDFENAQFGYTQNQNAINRAQNQVYQGIGSYYQAEQAGRTNKLTDAMTKYYGG